MARQCSLIILLLSLLPPFLPTGDSDLAGDKAALLAFYDAVGGRMDLWKDDDLAPCNWSGVRCDTNGVTAIHLPGFDLSGVIPLGTIGNLTKLRTISLRYNALSGPIPSDLSRCKDLHNLNLRGNKLSGEIPESIFDMHALVHLDLSHNNISGPVSSRFSNFTRMKTLFLENNKLVGSLPDLALAKLKVINVSSNLLNGSVPSSLASFPRTAFIGNSLCGGPLPFSCAGNQSPALPYSRSVDVGTVIRTNGKKKLSGAAVAGIVIGSVVGFMLICLILFIVYRSKSTTRTRTLDVASTKYTGRDSVISGEKQIREVDMGGKSSLNNEYPGAAATSTGNMGTNGSNKKLVFVRKAAQVFDLEDLLRASAEVLGKGTFGTAYKATLEAGIEVAVKRLRDVVSSEREFMEKVEIVGCMDHQNLVPLRAYFYSRDEKLLVYDYMPMGSLAALLHGNRGVVGRNPLNREIRLRVALGTARGIAYLHAQGPTISHGNLKSSNVLLTRSLDASVSDFALAHLVGPPSNPTRVLAYRAPEVTEPRRSSQRSDVYSFGILLLELLTGKPPTNAVASEEGVDLRRWVQSVVRERWCSEVLDPEMGRGFEGETTELLQVAIDCSDPHPDKRPSMSAVVRIMEELIATSGGKDSPSFE